MNGHGCTDQVHRAHRPYMELKEFLKLIIRRAEEEFILIGKITAEISGFRVDKIISPIALMICGDTIQQPTNGHG